MLRKCQQLLARFGGVNVRGRVRTSLCAERFSVRVLEDD